MNERYHAVLPCGCTVPDGGKHQRGCGEGWDLVSDRSPIIGSSPLDDALLLLAEGSMMLDDPKGAVPLPAQLETRIADWQRRVHEAIQANIERDISSDPVDHRHRGVEGVDFPDHHGVGYSTGSDYSHAGIDRDISSDPVGESVYLGSPDGVPIYGVKRDISSVYRKWVGRLARTKRCARRVRQARGEAVSRQVRIEKPKWSGSMVQTDAIRRVLEAIQREAVDAFIEKELPGLLAPALNETVDGDPGLVPSYHAGEIAAKIAELRSRPG